MDHRARNRDYHPWQLDQRCLAKERYESKIGVIEPMATRPATTHMTTTMADNEIKGGLAGRLVWRSSLDDSRDLDDAMCMSCYLCVTTIRFSVQPVGTRLIHLIVTPESIRMIGSYARNLGPRRGVSTFFKVAISSSESASLPNLVDRYTPWFDHKHHNAASRPGVQVCSMIP